MWFVFYRAKNLEGHAGPWRAHTLPFNNEADANECCVMVLAYKASDGQQEYAAAVARFVEL